MALDVVVQRVAVLSGKSESLLRATDTLASLGIGSSLQITRLQTALARQLGRSLPPLGAHLSLAAIAGMIGGHAGGSQPVSAKSTVAGPSPQPSAVFAAAAPGLGVDIQEIGELPETADYRAHEFYAGVFADEEISYAVLRPDPKASLCGMFCAKEALRKTDPRLSDIPFRDIVIEHMGSRPMIKLIGDSVPRAFSFRVSISHASHYAVATVLAFETASAAD